MIIIHLVKKLQYSLPFIEQNVKVLKKHLY